MDPRRERWTLTRGGIEERLRRECGLTRDQAREVVHTVFGSPAGKPGILQEFVALGYRVRIERLFSIEAKTRKAYRKRMPDGRIITVPQKVEPKVTLSRRFKEYVAEFGEPSSRTR